MYIIYILYILYIIYIYYIYIIYNIYICYHENNVPSHLSPQWPRVNSCTWAHDVRLHIAGTNEPKSVNKLSKEHNINSSQFDHNPMD